MAWIPTYDQTAQTSMYCIVSFTIHSPFSFLFQLIAAHRAEAGRGSGGTGEGGSKEDQLLASEMRKK
jgi:hypothetical protein